MSSYLGIGMRRVVMKGQATEDFQREVLCKGVVLYIHCSGGYTHLYIGSNCMQAHTRVRVCMCMCL